MATIVKKGPYQYQAQIRKKGYPDVYKTFEKKKDAVDFAAQIESEMIRGKYINRNEADSTTLYEALDRYEREVSIRKKGYETEKWRIGAWKRHRLANTALSNLRSSDFAKYRDERLLDGKSASTIRNDLALISHLFTIAIQEWNIPLINPTSGVRKPQENNDRSRLFQKDEESRILNAIKEASIQAHWRANPWIEPIVIFAIETSMRMDEILSLDWSNIDLINYTATAIDTKNDETKVVPLSEKAVEILKNLPKICSNKVININTANIKSPAILENQVFKTTNDALDQSWRRAIKRARKTYEQEQIKLGKSQTEIINDKLLTDFHFHDLRHEAITRLASIFELHELMKITGHKSSRMLARYYHPKASDLAKKLRSSKI